jgi:SPP1 family predicted phage head-tail adaptor
MIYLRHIAYQNLCKMIGNLDRRIVLKDYTTSQNDYGELEQTWTTTATTWAWVRFGAGNERMIANKETVVGDCIFTIRYRTGVTERTKVVFDSTDYDIQHIAQIGRRKYLELTARKIV